VLVERSKPMMESATIPQYLYISAAVTPLLFAAVIALYLLHRKNDKAINPDGIYKSWVVGGIPVNNGPPLTPAPAVQRAAPAASPSLFSAGAPIVPPKAFGSPNYMASSNPFGGTSLFNAAQQRQ
jgi:hypothetical protein